MASKGEPIIHVGFPKCASTFLQQEIFPRISSYEFIQDPDTAKTHKILCSRYYHDLPEGFLFFRLGRSRYIFSNEGILNICEHWSDGGLKNYEREIAISNITRIFRDYGKILVVIRRQDEIAESLFRHKAWKFFAKPENVFLDLPIQKTENGFKLLTSTGRIFTEAFDYYKWIMRIANQLGKERVHILVYEDLVYAPESFFERLGCILGEDTRDLIQYKDNKRNVSLKEQIVLPNYTRPLRRIKPLLPSRLLGLKRIFKRRISFGETYKLKLLNLYKCGNKLLSTEFGLDLDKYGYF